MRKIEINIMALLIKKGARDNKLPKDELSILKKSIKKYPAEHQKILRGKKPY